MDELVGFSFHERFILSLQLELQQAFLQEQKKATPKVLGDRCWVEIVQKLIDMNLVQVPRLSPNRTNIRSCALLEMVKSM